jgi:hypothetical protein
VPAAPAWQYLVSHAAYGFEADDVLAAAVQWVSAAVTVLTGCVLRP